jgi:hypothetical protein
LALIARLISGSVISGNPAPSSYCAAQTGFSRARSWFRAVVDVRFGAGSENYGLARQMPPGEQLHFAELFQSIRSKRYFSILAAI